MTPELTQKLQQEFPDFFRDLYGDPRETCLAFGIDFGAGWFDILHEACVAVKKELETHPELDFKFLQLKEKFGTARLYASGGNTAIWDILSEAELKSASVCESCGTTEDVTTEGGWLLTLCQTCRSKKK